MPPSKDPSKILLLLVTKCNLPFFMIESIYFMFIYTFCSFVSTNFLFLALHNDWYYSIRIIIQFSILWTALTSRVYKKKWYVKTVAIIVITIQVVDLIRDIIMSTDLTNFFPNHKELSKLLVAQTLDWTIDHHRLEHGPTSIFFKCLVWGCYCTPKTIITLITVSVE